MQAGITEDMIDEAMNQYMDQLYNARTIDGRELQRGNGSTPVAFFNDVSGCTCSRRVLTGHA